MYEGVMLCWDVRYEVGHENLIVSGAVKRQQSILDNDENWQLGRQGDLFFFQGFNVSIDVGVDP